MREEPLEKKEEKPVEAGKSKKKGLKRMGTGTVDIKTEEETK